MMRLGEREMEMKMEGEGGRSWWTVAVNGREGVLNDKWYIRSWDRRVAGVGDHV